MRLSIANHNNEKNPKGFINYEINFLDIPLKVKSGFCYSACKFKDNYRLDSNYEGCEDVLILDIDDECNIEQAQKIFSEYHYFIITSKSHQKLKNDKVCDRFRIFIELEETINNFELREKFINNIMDRYSFVDKACKNRSRFYYSSPFDALVLHNKGCKMKIIDIENTFIHTETKKEIKSINYDEVYILDFLTGLWVNKYGESLENENTFDNIESKLKGACVILDNEFYKGNRNNAMFKVISMLLNDGLNDDDILDFITKENEIRGKIGFNELMACFKSAKRNI